MLNLYLTLIDTDEDKLRFTALYQQYRHLMFYIAREVLCDEHLSEDAVQEAFLRIAKNFHKIGEIPCPQTRNLVVIITKNIAITMVSHNNNKEIDAYTQIEEPATSNDIFETVSNRILVECILQLPVIYRDSLYLYHIYGYSFREVSNLLSISVETAKKRVQRARRLLKEMLEKEGF